MRHTKISGLDGKSHFCARPVRWNGCDLEPTVRWRIDADQVPDDFPIVEPQHGHANTLAECEDAVVARAMARAGLDAEQPSRKRLAAKKRGGA